MRVLGLGLSDHVPDARTIWLFREWLTKAGAIQSLFERFDTILREPGYIAMSGQIVDSSLVAAPKQRNTKKEKDDIKAGRIPKAWKDKPTKLRHKDRDARWTVKFTKAKPQADGTLPPVDIAISAFGYQNHISIDRKHGLIRKWLVTDAAAYEGARLREGLLDQTNTARTVWADAAYRSNANEAFMEKNGFVTSIHPKKPAGRPMPGATRHANNLKSKTRSPVEHVFAEQKSRMGLFIRTVGNLPRHHEDRACQHPLQHEAADPPRAQAVGRTGRRQGSRRPAPKLARPIKAAEQGVTPRISAETANHVDRTIQLNAHAGHRTRSTRHQHGTSRYICDLYPPSECQNDFKATEYARTRKPDSI